MEKYWRSYGSSSQPMWKRGRSHPVLVKTKAGWENRGGAKPADIASGNMEHVDGSINEVMRQLRDVNWRKELERCLESLSWAPGQRQGAKGRTDRPRQGRRQCLMMTNRSICALIPSLSQIALWPKSAGTCSSSVRSECKALQPECFSCTAGYAPPEPGLAVLRLYC